MSLEIQEDNNLSASYNHNFLALDKQTKKQWVGKINKRLKNVCNKGGPDIYDLDERALLAFDLAKLIGINIPQTKKLKFNSIDNNKSLLEGKGKDEFYDFDNIIFTEHISGTVVSEIKDISIISPSNILPLLIFDSWIGNLDKKEDDYIFDEQNDKLWSIDYQLWGPRDINTKKVFGYCARLYDFTEQNIVEFCIPERMKNLLIDFNYSNELNKIITKIESVSDQDIQKFVNKYDFRGTNESSVNNMNQTLINFLIEGKDQIRKKMIKILKSITKKNILIIGSGGREHALAWKLKQSPKVSKIFIAPGNAGTALLGENLSLKSSSEIIEWLKDNEVSLVVIGPDDYLAEGLTDKIKELNIPVFGPTQMASQIEWSKSFAKKLMEEEGIPTAKSKTFNDILQAKKYITDQTYPLVVKASGLALGKGVFIVKTFAEAEVALNDMMNKKIFGSAGDEVIIEEYLEGREFSVHAFCDGETVRLFPSSQDHKRIFEDDKGPNTGGMGTIAPVPWVTKELLKEIEDKIINPCLRGLKRRGAPFVGILYPGIMVTSCGPKVIEFNARFGDPEAQPYMRILETDLFDILQACVNGNLQNMEVKWSNNFASCVVCASGGYPGKYEKGKKINGLDLKDEGIVIFHAGTKKEGKDILTNGGRVLGVTSTAVKLKDSLEKSYQAIKNISFTGMQYRKDIGSSSL